MMKKSMALRQILSHFVVRAIQSRTLLFRSSVLVGMGVFLFSFSAHANLLCYSNLPASADRPEERSIVSPTGNYIAEPMHGECDSMHIAIRALKGGRNYATSRGYRQRQEGWEQWGPAVEYLNGFCWHPTKDILFTAPRPGDGEVGIYKWDIAGGEVVKLFHPRTVMKMYRGKKGNVDYSDDIGLANISSDGRYLMVYYDPDFEDEKSRAKKYVFDTKNGNLIKFKKFMKKHPEVRFVDAMDR